MNKIINFDESIENQRIDECLFLLSNSSIIDQKKNFIKFENELSIHSIQKLSRLLILNHPFLSKDLIKYIFEARYSNLQHIIEFLKKEPEISFNIIAQRLEASEVESKKIVIFCQPKSGSTFVANLISNILDFPFMNLTTFGVYPSNLGINGKSQEICEFALIDAIFKSKNNKGFVAQHHTTSSLYLINLINYFKIKPIILTRNIFDSLVSLNDMFMQGWSGKSFYNQHPAILEKMIPSNFVILSYRKRLEILTRIYGPWYVNFYLSWKSFSNKVEGEVCWITYEEEILKKQKLIERLTKNLQLNNVETEKLINTLKVTNKSENRFNKGVAGRGKDIDQNSRKFLIEYSKIYESQFTKDDFNKMFEFYT